MVAGHFHPRVFNDGPPLIGFIAGDFHGVGECPGFVILTSLVAVHSSLYMFSANPRYS